MNGARIEALGDQALLVRLGERIDPAINRRVHALAARILEHRPPWLLDCVPAYASLAVFFDAAQFPDRCDPSTSVQAWLEPLLSAAGDADTAEPGRLFEIPVCYGRDCGPDLQEVATASGFDADEVIARHHAPIYTVAMIGFAAGFPYLLGLDPALSMPRLATPRASLAAGSVAIGGGQTGIYPRASPGGWRIIGRTPLNLFDARRDPPALLAPGDRVRFVPVGIEAFARHGAPR